ncbi:DNA binding domain-containing protein, excisionase family [Amycolatopsis xylanica]|uniref:DNA binding domain-containing protein, excisionase family n=1 Tax=Amycolatopsis xylanica TaxID=589385 RepID=A0A1H3DRM5_9PSEU|nr:excisionase family DNA-binding protein [Amycolatopsis xylanica]SDX69046.1 DNA binding domain-containing protein, excisionase family [Amycolatopsis xylanica]
MERLPGWLSVREAASRLEVAPEHVYELIAAGRLEAVQPGRELLVRSDSVWHRTHVVRPQAGRPWSPRMAWAVMWQMSGLRPTWLSSSEQVRAQRYVRRPPEQWPRLLSARAQKHEALMLPAALKKLLNRKAVCVGGLEAGVAHGAQLVSDENHRRELYVSPKIFDELRGARGIRWNSEAPNVTFRVVPGPIVDQVTLPDIAPPAVAAADLLDTGDERSTQAAKELLRRAAILRR